MFNIDTAKILDQKMNRKQFLKNVGIGVIAFSGVTAALRAVGQSATPIATTQQPAANANTSYASYGGSVYGGRATS